MAATRARISPQTAANAIQRRREVSLRRNQIARHTTETDEAMVTRTKLPATAQGNFHGLESGRKTSANEGNSSVSITATAIRASPTPAALDIKSRRPRCELTDPSPILRIRNSPTHQPPMRAAAGLSRVRTK
jgi:hypothetical protein